MKTPVLIIGEMFVNKMFYLFLFLSASGVNAKDRPQFIGTSTNVTSVVGRDATLVCKVDNLVNYKVAWLRVDTQTILTIGPHVITKNHRVGVTRGDGRSWTLALKEVRPSDGGEYMCQINTEPMITQTHHLQVVVPPDIMDSGSSGEIMVREGENVSLHCGATGTPPPNITWRREDFSQMTIAGESVHKWSGVWLNMSRVERTMNGAFLCIATNGVPPSVSKRILLHVLCAPSVFSTQNMIGGYLGDSVLVQCEIEAYPAPAIYWTHVSVNRLQNGTKYQVNMKSESYLHTARLRINNLSREDIGNYQCHVENTMGTAIADITVYTLVTSTTSTTSSTTVAAENITMPHKMYAELDELHEEEEINKRMDNDDYVIVLSQHQLQNLDLSPSL